MIVVVLVLVNGISSVSLAERYAITSTNWILCPVFDTVLICPYGRTRISVLGEIA